MSFFFLEEKSCNFKRKKKLNVNSFTKKRKIKIAFYFFFYTHCIKKKLPGLLIQVSIQWIFTFFIIFFSFLNSELLWKKKLKWILRNLKKIILILFLKILKRYPTILHSWKLLWWIQNWNCRMNHIMDLQ